MFKKLMVLALILSGCGTLPPPGNYIVQPIKGTITPDYTYCESGQCYNFVLSDTVFEPTSETFPVPSPLPTSAVPTPTPIQPVYICPLLDSVNVRQSANTTSSILYVLLSGQRMLLATSYAEWYQVVYRGVPAYISKSYSKVCSDGVLIS